VHPGQRVPPHDLLICQRSNRIPIRVRLDRRIAGLMIDRNHYRSISSSSAFLTEIIRIESSFSSVETTYRTCFIPMPSVTIRSSPNRAIVDPGFPVRSSESWMHRRETDRACSGSGDLSRVQTHACDMVRLRRSFVKGAHAGPTGRGRWVLGTRPRVFVCRGELHPCGYLAFSLPGEGMDPGAGRGFCGLHRFPYFFCLFPTHHISCKSSRETPVTPSAGGPVSCGIYQVEGAPGPSLFGDRGGESNCVAHPLGQLPPLSRAVHSDSISTV